MTYRYVLKHPTQISLKYKGEQPFALENFFRNFGSGFGLPCGVTSEVNISDNHSLPLDIASTSESVLFL